MKRSLNLLIRGCLSFLTIILFFCFPLTPEQAKASGWKLEVPFEFGLGGATDKIDDPVEYINAIYKFVVYVAGVLGLAMFMIGGFQYLTAAGNTSKTGEAKTTIFSALIGIIILVTGYLLLRIINKELVELTKPETKTSVTVNLAVKYLLDNILMIFR
ncbi:MAG: hypothetical protein GF332_01550 [Candidatus Moranbacteria bacterium]|nr:hypothetical protein [Candidatus Moranbacteria bacterium]